jgi:uncharacterized protein involved in type VI secretion and phage assembly
MTDYYGKYRGKVENNVDPQRLGRIQVSCPSVLGDGPISWARPSAPYAGSGVGFLAIPPIGANVWVEFEAGNTELPIWSGCFWEDSELPSEMGMAEKKVFKTDAATLTLSDLPGPTGGVTIETKDGKKITMNAQSIEITDGKWSIKLTPGSVSINNGALEVT